MGINTKTIEIITCDICGVNCGKNDSDINIQVNGGDGRDVGPATINAKLVFNQPYGCSNGIVCFDCKIKFLKQYLKDK
jgi:hypothetical protein